MCVGRMMCNDSIMCVICLGIMIRIYSMRCVGSVMCVGI